MNKNKNHYQTLIQILRILARPQWVVIFFAIMFPADTKYCHTLHVMDTRGESVSVTKRCVALDDCLLAGCAEITDSGYRVCWNSAP